MIDLANASIHIEAPQKTVFDLFTTEDGLRSWMAKDAAVDLQPGGSWRWVHENDAAASGEYVTVEPYDRVSFTFGWESGPYTKMGPGSTTVEVTFAPAEGGTTVTVTHSAVPEDLRQAHYDGWSHFIGVLADVAGASAATAPSNSAGHQPQH